MMYTPKEIEMFTERIKDLKVPQDQLPIKKAFLDVLENISLNPQQFNKFGGIPGHIEFIVGKSPIYFINTQKIIEAPLEDMPLYINDNLYMHRVLATWRMEIAK
jgi:hypothetical protein